jgi:pimeloyl-ACP methyl ester carboxylesterase
MTQTNSVRETLQPPSVLFMKKKSISRIWNWMFPPPAERGWIVRIRGYVFMFLLCYLIFCIVLASFQRSLIYYPTRAHPLELAATGVGRTHDIVATTEDDLQLHGWHVLRNGQICPDREACDRMLAETDWLILFFHGNAGNRKGREFDCQLFGRLGGDVFIFDYRGYGENEGSPSEEGLAMDAHAIWNYATRERHVPPERIILYGASLGGGVATRLASELCEAGTPPGGLILRSTFSSMTDAASYHYPWLPVRWVLVDRFSSDARIKHVVCPILQIHGGKDTLVPIDLGRKLFDQAPDKSSNGIEKAFVEIPMADHNDVIHGHTKEVRDAVRAFVTRLQL